MDVTIDDGISKKTLVKGYEYVENFEEEDDDGGKKGGGSLIEKLISPDTGIGGVLGLVILGEVVLVVAGVAVFFRVRES